MNNEAAYKLALVKSIRAEGGYARRVEDKFTVGMPDIFMIPTKCMPVWAEVKVVTHQSFGPTPRQLVELKRVWVAPYCAGIIIGVKHNKLYVSYPVDKVRLEECLEQQDDETPGDLIRRLLQHENEH